MNQGPTSSTSSTTSTSSASLTLPIKDTDLFDKLSDVREALEKAALEDKVFDTSPEVSKGRPRSITMNNPSGTTFNNLYNIKPSTASTNQGSCARRFPIQQNLVSSQKYNDSVNGKRRGVK